jgi:ABC-2 type transport system ATP-binding protein
MTVIEVEALTRTYRSRTGVVRRRTKIVEALRGVSFSVEPGELFGLLGPNGAGKTTMIKILTTLLLPSSGSARVLGHDVRREARRIRGRIGYVFGGDRGLYDRLSGYDNLRYFADLYKVSGRERRARIESLLELVDLKGRERERVETYSRGMKQRLHIARGLLHNPEILFLDEPTIGLDPLGARELRAMIAGLHERGKTVLLTTHYMYEADALCEQIAVIANGVFVAHGTPAELKALVGDQTIVEIETFGIGDEVVERLRRIPGVKAVGVETRDHAQVLLIQSAVGAEIVRTLLNELADADADTGKVITREPTLEDAYVELVRAA